MSVKINKLEIENIKRVKAVKIKPTATGLTVIGGNNNQGKTSILDSIAWALGGDKYKPSNAERDGSTIPPHLSITLSNGLVVERKGKNSSLKVIDPNGRKGGQQLLNEFVEQLALDLPKFMESSNKEKAQILLRIIGVGDQLAVLERKEQEIYNNRLIIGQTADRKKKFADEQEYYVDVPKEIISPSELIQKQQAVLLNNAENQSKRERKSQIEAEVKQLQEQLMSIQTQLTIKLADLEIANKDALDLQDESTEELEKNLLNIEELNRKIRANLDKEKAEEDAREYTDQYNALTLELHQVRDEKQDLLKNANLPLAELSVEDGELVYKGKKWDSMSGSEQLRVSTAIVRKLNPECGFVLLDKVEQMDLITLNEFGEWLEQEGLQAIATRVSTGDECSIIIDDGYVVSEQVETEILSEPVAETNKWKVGEF